MNKKVTNHPNISVYAIILIIIVALMAVFALYRNLVRKPAVKTPQSIENTQTLPVGWHKVDNGTGLSLKLQKDSKEAVIPTIVLLETSLPEGTLIGNYIDTLKAGAVSTIPHLNFTSDDSSENNGFRIYRLTAGYVVNRHPVNLIQRIYSKESKIYIFTASYLKDSKNTTESEINGLLDTLSKDNL
ncbi:MAG TPA: hypothetical protein VF828_05305 [Patescibacteria group bacterium]